MSRQVLIKTDLEKKFQYGNHLLIGKNERNKRTARPCKNKQCVRNRGLTHGLVRGRCQFLRIHHCLDGASAISGRLYLKIYFNLRKISNTLADVEVQSIHLNSLNVLRYYTVKK